MLTNCALLPKLAKAAGMFVPALFDVSAFGAIGDGAAINTKSIQAAIDACSTAGGGTVLVSGGNYVTGTLFLKSNVSLQIEAGSTLSGSPKIEDYPSGTGRNMYDHEPQLDRCLIFAKDAMNIGIHGAGTIDGHGASFPNQGDTARYRPMMLRFINCRNLFVNDVTLQNPAAWTSAFLYCTDVRVNGINISSRVRGNGDGLDFDGCKDVRVSNCRLDNSDDSICLQTSEPSKPIRNVVITNCVMTSQWAAIRIGLLSRGDFEDVVVSNCIFHDIVGEGLKIQMAEGGRMQNFLFSNIVMHNVPRPVFLTFNSFAFRVDLQDEPPAMQSLRNITFSNITIESDSTAEESRNSFIALLGLPEHPIEDITFENITFIAAGGGSKTDSTRRNVPELAGLRPERQPLGSVSPSYGLFARHVRNLKLTNVSLQTREKDLRPAIFCDEVEQLRIVNLGVGGDVDTDALILLRNTKNVLLQGSYSIAPSSTFLRVEGSKSSEIAMLNNDLRLSKNAFRLDTDVPPRAVTAIGNLQKLS